MWDLQYDTELAESRTVQNPTSLGDLLQKMHTQFLQVGVGTWNLSRAINDLRLAWGLTRFSVCWTNKFLTVNILSTILWTAGSVNSLGRADSLTVWLIHHQPACWFLRLINRQVAVMSYISKPQTSLQRFLSVYMWQGLINRNVLLKTW